MVDSGQERKKGGAVVGTVVSRSGAKSVKVAIDCKVKHPRYGKYVKSRTTLGVHDEREKAGIGDLVEVAECRPYSKTKSWRLVKILQTCGRIDLPGVKEQAEQ